LLAGTPSDAKGAFEVIAAHLAGRRTELTVAIEHGWGVEGWFQHEAAVALESAFRAGVYGRVFSLRRAGVRALNAPASSTPPPFHLMFDEPEMAACLRLFLPWQSVEAATATLQQDVIALGAHPHHGFIIAGRLDLRDGLSAPGQTPRSGAKWLTEAVRGARGGLKLKSLAESDLDASAQCLQIDLHPMEWSWPDGTDGYRQPILHLGAWSVLKPA